MTDTAIYTHESDSELYSLAFSTRKDTTLRMAAGTLEVPSSSSNGGMTNKVEIVQLNESKNCLEKVTEFEHKIPPSKIMWFPEHSSDNPDLLVTSSDTLKIWELVEEGHVEIKSSFWNTQQTEFSAPLTSFDWNSRRLEVICTCSIDTTCSIWDITKGAIINQLIAHDKEVFDIKLAPDAFVFSTVGADGSLRQFDTRDLSKSDILYEGDEPLLRLSWNKTNDNHIGFIGLDQNFITIIDKRKPFIPCHQLYYHTGKGVNSVAWSPYNSDLIGSGGDDGKALIWDISELKPQIKSPTKEYETGLPVKNFVWGINEKNWVGTCYGKTLQLMKVDHTKKGI